jgi:hypothetical protein
VFTVFNALSDNSQRKSLSLSDRFFTGVPVLHDARQLDNLGYPATVALLFCFNGISHLLCLLCFLETNSAHTIALAAKRRRRAGPPFCPFLVRG